jgi:hypothetical protein
MIIYMIIIIIIFILFINRSMNRSKSIKHTKKMFSFLILIEKE